MKRILDQTHDKYTFIYACSRLLERTSYYGLRSLIVLYMIGESINMTTQEALQIYGWFTVSIVFSQILGALLGDLLVGNKKSIIIGGVLQALGAFCFCIPSIIGLYIGLALVVLGGGFYTPNIIAHFGKLYLNKTKLLDSGFTIFYLAVNVGAFIGVVTIGYLGEKLGWNIGFIIAGVVALLSVVLPLISADQANNQVVEKKLPEIQRALKVLIAFVIVGLFWGLYEISGIRFHDLQFKFGELAVFDTPKSIWSSLNTIFIIPVSFVIIILWTYFYSNQFIKLAIGFLFGAISYAVLLAIPETPTAQYSILYLVSILFLSISEVHIAPVINSVLTQHTNPKYLAIMISIAFVPIKLFLYIVGLFNEALYENSSLALKIGMIGMVVMTIGLVMYILIDKILTRERG
ncbi:MFS transporter [Aquimarina sediminis]|uniref:MFS transporter n=1 Tax=Aquimarina sediminis TaxID=2070536 RepID=UPI000C9FFFFF|nr:MFS transporter [Aquimarina sediminis]